MAPSTRSGSRRRPALLAAVVVTMGVGAVLQASLPVAASVAQSEPGQISPEVVAQIESRARRLASGSLSELPEATRRRILLDFINNHLAEAANLPGFDTNLLSPAEREQAAAIVDRVLAAQPSPPAPQPAPPPQPAPEPAPAPQPYPAPAPPPAPAPELSILVVWPSYVVEPQPLVYVQSPSWVTYVPAAEPKLWPGGPLRLLHWRGR